MMIEVNYVHFHNLNRNVLDLGKQVRELSDENARLKAEVERLTKAGEGNSMWGVVAPYVVPPCIDKYTAKEGKQP